MPRHRILIVNSTLHVGGAEQMAANLAGRIDTERFEVAVCYLKQNGVVGETMRRDGVELLRLPGFVEGKIDYFSSLKLHKLIKQRGIDLIHTHDLHGLIDGSICRLLTTGLCSVHTFHFGNYPHREPRYKRIEQLLWRLPDCLVAVGYEQMKSIQTTYGIPEERVRVVWNGVDFRKLPIDERLAESLNTDQRVVIGSISTLIEQKGIPVLLDAIQRLRDRREDFVVVIVGDGHLREPMQRKARELGVAEYVQFMGWIPEAAARALPRFDVFVQSSLWEAMSMVVLEAMAAARPMVVTGVGENPQVVEDGKSGLIVPPNDAGALADRLETLIADVRLRQRLGEQARVRYETLFKVSDMVQRYEALYEELLAGRR